MLSEDRRQKVLDRVGRLMKEVDAEARLNEVLLDSTRQQLAFVLQKGEWPIVIGMNYLDYVSLRDDDLKASLAAAFQQRLAAARRREEAE
ncbi:MAG: hypothetical protein ACRD5F_12635 [Candidatus Acidiferrales bacterium]